MRVIAAQYGFSVESRESQQSLANVRLGATAVGMLHRSRHPGDDGRFDPRARVPVKCAR